MSVGNGVQPNGFGKANPRRVLAAFVAYAVGFAARPVGGIVFGQLGDRYLRKKLLQFSLVLVWTSPTPARPGPGRRNLSKTPSRPKTRANPPSAQLTTGSAQPPRTNRHVCLAPGMVMP